MTPAFARPLLVTANLLDRVRSLLLSWFGRPLSPLFRDRELRIAWLGATSIVVTLVFTVWAPGLLLTWGPLLLGVPHLVADGRYLIARRGLFARPFALLLVVLPALGAWSGGGASMGALSIVAAGVVAQATVLPRLGVIAVGLGFAATAHRFGRTADLAFAHLHNLVAIAAWLAWPWMTRGARSTWRHLVVVGTFVVAALLLATGRFDRWAFPALFAVADINELIPRFAFDTSPTWAVRATLLFAFAQSVHYGVWLRLMPDEDRERTAPRPFARSVEALAVDLSWPVVILATLVTLAFLAYGAFDAVAARDGYLRLALFHGPMELGLIALLLVERR